jgi:hypothetical protein
LQSLRPAFSSITTALLMLPTFDIDQRPTEILQLATNYYQKGGDVCTHLTHDQHFYFNG